MKGQILLISGPSGSGKSTLINRLMKEEKDIYFSISCTT
ncbi:MAG: ATP-binding cassette domain-containing protein, partial [Campylobacter sp.]|nr:ATP-binding cassette domain-containing protein [Campylobacter sp.]